MKKVELEWGEIPPWMELIHKKGHCSMCELGWNHQSTVCQNWPRKDLYSLKNCDENKS